MKLKLTAFIAAWLTIAATFGYAQTFKIAGKIKHGDGATIYLNTAADSILVKTALADSAGGFVFEHQKQGRYKLTVSSVGFQTYHSGIIRLDSNKLLSITLVPNAVGLNAVTINAQKPLVEHRIDRTVVNVDALISNTGSTALDVLEKSPGVIVDENGAISLKGKSVKIFIDDKPTYLSGAELESYLRSLPSSAMDQVELMSNPPARYDAAGNGGIINIRTKKSKLRGFNGGINLSYSQGIYSKTNNSFNFNYRNNKLNVSGSLGYLTNNNFNDLNINRHFFKPDGSAASNFIQNSFIRRTAKNYRSKLAVDYYLSDQTTLGIGLTGLSIPSDENTLAASQSLDAGNKPDSTILADNRTYEKFKNGGVNLNYRHQYDKKGTELAADFDYIRYTDQQQQTFLNSSYLPGGRFTGTDLLTGSLPSNINIYAFKTDYSHPLSNGLKLDAGLKTSYTRTDNIAEYFETVGSAVSPDYTKTNHFIYKENINAAYLNAGRDWKRLSVQTGLRFENTGSNGHQLGNVQKPDSVFKRNYNGLFLTVYVQYKLDTAGKQLLSLTYGRRIDRPYFEDLNPFLKPLDKFTYYTGNPFLKPSYTQNTELSYSWHNITGSVSYSKSHDDVNETIEILNGIYYSRPGNLGSTVIKSLTIDAAFEPAKWFNFHLFGFIQNIHVVSDFYTGTLNTQGTFYFIKPVTEFKPGKDWTVQLDGGYQSKITSGQFVVGNRGKLNTALSKKLTAGTTVKLVVNDIFHSFTNSGQINNLAATKADYRNISDTRTAVLSLSYRFGQTIAGQRKKGNNAAEDEQNRVKN
ncbi:TonB dependent receptor [Mucilaginibacter sp. UR6-11]|uniref:TonB dependent receptor n=1 Tax=Mucilaginibacter sp. UR6-11 TaxID=1435644 RepID=UPI001E417083|nr:TonB dependent receptor [Mucilaginibacter sp. UR6-11]MCC8425946.1 TonB-dependent receptor [Mucilaginibacter sp. UR6-11]